MGDAVNSSGPLSNKNRALIKLALSTGAGMKGAVHSHTRKALKKGVPSEAIRQKIFLALPTLVLHKMLVTFIWVEDILSD